MKDEHGAWNLETVTITITGSNDAPSLTVGDPDGLLYESGVGRDTTTSDHRPFDKPGQPEENNPYDNDAAGTASVTGSINAADVDHGDILHFAVADGTGVTTPEGLGLTTGSQTSVTAQGHYGQLVVTETANGTASYTYTLHGNSDGIPLTFPVTVNGTIYAGLEELKQGLDWDFDGQPTLDNLPEGATVSESFTIFVQDDKGAWQQQEVSFTITGTNDQPEVTLDADSELGLIESGVGRTDDGQVVTAPGTEEENQAYDGSHADDKGAQQLEGKVTGADVDAGHKLWFGAVAGDKSRDGSWEGAQSPDADIFLGKDATDGDVESSEPVEGSFGHLVLNSDGTWTYTLKGEGEAVQGTASLDGETFDISSIDALPEGATITDTFTIYVKDEHGAWNLETVTITITGSNDKPSLEIRDGNGQILTDGAVLETIESDPADADDATSWPQLSGSFDIRDVDADAGSDQTILIAGGTHTDGDVEHATSPAAGHEPQPGHIGSEGGTQAIFTTDYGTLTVNPDGSWTYVVNSGSELVQQLDPEHPHFETFEITVVDEHGAYDTREIVIKVEGSSAFPVITDKDDLVFKEEGVYHDGSDGNTPTEAGDVVDGQGNVIPGHHQTESLSGRVDATDVDLGDQGNLSFRVDAADAQLKTDGTPAVTQPEAPKLVSTSPNGDTVYESGYGTLTFHADGTYTYELKSGAFDADGNAVNKLAQGEVLTETFTVTVKDTFGKEVSTDITITIHGTNDKPRLELGDGSDGGALHVTESGVGRHDDGAVVDGPDDELVDAPSKDGTAADEIGRYDGALTDSDKATGKDADHGAELVYGVEAGKAESPDGVDFTTDGGDVSVRGQYGSLTIGADGSYSYTLDESSDFTAGDGTQYDRLDYLNEGETLTETFTIFVRDEHGAWASKEVTVTVTGTNDRPTLDVLDGKKFFDASGKEIAVADDRLHAYGTADSAADAVVRLSGRVQASDDDRENGAGQETTDGDNHGLQFSLQGTGYDPALTSSSVWKDSSGHDPRTGPVEVSRSGDGGYVATTEYGTLTLDQYGNYTYELHEGDDDVTALGKGESVTETFVVRVVDDRGAWSEKTITITIEGTDDKPVLSDDTKSVLDVYETGVWGDQPGAHRPDDIFTGGPTGSQTVTVSFEKQDANDRHSLVIAGSGLPANASLTVTDGGTPVEGAIYSIVAGANGTYTLTAVIPGVNEGKSIMLGTLRLEQNGTDSDLTYTFVPTQSGLNGLPQDMDLSIDIPLKVKDQNGNLSEGEHTATINIHGTNDRPTIKVTGRAPEDVYADGVGREENGIAVATPDKTELNPEENAPYESRSVEGQLTASDVDAGDTTFSYFVDKVGGISNPALTATVGDGRTTVTLSLSGVAVAELTLDPATGKYSLSLLDTDEARAALAPYGEDVKFDFTVYFNVRDEHGSTAQTSASQKFSIHGTNDAPEIKDASDLGMDEGMVSVAGQVSAEDADAGHKLTYGLLSDPDFGSLNGADPESVGMTTSLSNEFGTLKIDPATGKYTFYLDAESEAVISLPEGEKKELTFHVAVRDDKGAWDVKDITVTITGKDTATVFVGDAAVVPVVEAGVVPDMHPGTENQSEDGSPVASGKLEAKDYDTVDGRPNEVEYSINTTENGQMPTTSAFSKLGPEIQDAISQQFPEEAWGADADIQIMQGQYGTLYLNTSTGQYFYQLDNGSDATNALKRGEIRYDDFSIHAQGTGKGDAQGADQPLKVAVKGSNDAPKVTGVTVDEGQTGLEVSDDGFTVTGIVEDGGTKTVTGQIGATDVDSPDGSTADEGSVLKYLIKVTGEDGSVRYVGAQSGEYGYLKLNEKTGEYTFVFNNKAAQHLGAGDIGEASFTVVVLDEYNAISEEKELTFEITGKDDAPRISGSAASITEDTEISVNIRPVTITDPDAGDEQHITSIASQGREPVDLTGNGPWKTEGEYGTLTVTRNEDGSLSYTYQLTEEGRNRLQYLNEDGAHTSVQENFTVTGTSGGQSVTGGITVTINGDNDAPTLELTGPDGQIVSEEDPVEVKDWNPVKGTAAGDDVDDAEGDLRYSVDDADSATAAQDGLQTIKGKFGYLTIDAETGEYTYVVDPFSEEYKKLQTGEQGKESFTITVTDPYGATGTKEIVFDVTKVEGGTGPGSIELQLQEPGDSTDVTEDGGSHEVILPPSVASGFTELKDSDGKPVKVDADDIWLVDNKGQSGIVDGDMTHVVQTEYGSLILEKGDDGQWGYRFVLNNSSDIVQSLDEGDRIEKTFYVSAGTNQVPIHVTITGINDQPVIESVGHLSIEDTGGIVTGRVTTTDPDAGDVGSNEAGEGSGQNLSYAVSAVEGSGITLTPKDGQAMGAPGTYTLTKDGTDWGEFTLNKDGSYSFKPSAEAEKLLAGENANFNLTITVDDGSDAPNSSTEENLHITITGTNEAPVINGGELTLEATEDTAITVGDKLDVSDDRVNEGNLSYSVAAGEGAASSNAGNMAAGQYGTLFINADGTYSYQLNNQMQAVQELGEDSEPLEETFTIFVKDQDGAEVAKTVTVTIKGTNDAPVLSLDTPVLTIKEGSTAEVGGTASATDVDKGDTLSYALKDGTLSEETGEYACKTDYGTFYINKETGAYRFELNNTLDAVKNLRPTDVVDAKVTVVVDDGHGGVTEKELTVHIKGSDSVPEITDEGSLAIDVAEEPGSESEGKIQADGWDRGPDGTHDDPLHYAAQGAQPVTIDGQVWQMVTGKYGTLYLDPKTGKYRYELTEDMNHLADGETATESFGKITIADSTGNKITETITVTINGTNDAPELSVSQPAGDLSGIVTIKDVDTTDTHDVTFEGLQNAAGTPLSVDLATLEQEGGTTTVDVYDADGTLIGKLELVYTKGTGTDDSLAYTFTPDEGYLNSLPVNGSQDIDFSITVSDTHDGTDTTDGLQFSVSNVNDAPVIDETLSQGPAEGSNTGTLAFTDADVRDVHSVTFDGLQDANGHALTVDNVEGLTGDREVPVYRDGLQIGTLTLSYADGKLSYTLSTEGFENNLPVGESSIGFDLTVTDAQGSSDQLGGLQFGVSNVNDAPVIDETLSQGPAEGSNTGTLAFTDADVRDVHSVTFDGLQDANGHALTVDNVEGLTGDREVPVYRDGLQIGTLTLSYADGKLSYTLSTEGFENNLPVGESSIGFDLTVTDAQGSSGTAEDLQFRVTGNGTTGGGIPAGEDDAALRAQSERQRLAAEESGLLTAAASFVAGITPESADPETFLQDTVPAQENGPEALVAEEIPLPQDETVLQEEMTDLPDADVPVSETPLADDLLAEPLLFAGLENADEMPEPVEMLRFETAEDMLPAEDTDPATAATPPAFNGEETEADGLLLPEGVEGLFGTDGDDYLRGGEGSDAIFGGAGNDIIVYDQQDYLVSGGSGIDFMVSDDTSLTLDGLLSNTSSDKPLVSGIEVLLKGEDALSLTSIKDLADRYGITLGVNEAGEEILQLDDRWTKQDDGSYDFNGGAEADGGLTLETNLTPVETGDPASEAVQQQVFTLEHSNG